MPNLSPNSIKFLSCLTKFSISFLKFLFVEKKKPLSNFSKDAS